MLSPQSSQTATADSDASHPHPSLPSRSRSPRLPPEVLELVFATAHSPLDLVVASLVCKEWRATVRSEERLWKEAYGRFVTTLPSDIASLLPRSDQLPPPHLPTLTTQALSTIWFSWWCFECGKEPDVATDTVPKSSSPSKLAQSKPSARPAPARRPPPTALPAPWGGSGLTTQGSHTLSGLPPLATIRRRPSSPAAAAAAAADPHSVTVAAWEFRTRLCLHCLVAQTTTHPPVSKGIQHGTAARARYSGAATLSDGAGAGAARRCEVHIAPRSNSATDSSRPGTSSSSSASALSVSKTTLYLRSDTRDAPHPYPTDATETSQPTIEANTRRQFFARLALAEYRWVVHCGQARDREVADRRAKKATQVAETLAASQAAHKPTRVVAPTNDSTPRKPQLPHRLGHVPAYIAARKAEGGRQRQVNGRTGGKGAGS